MNRLHLRLAALPPLFAVGPGFRPLGLAVLIQMFVRVVMTLGGGEVGWGLFSALLLTGVIYCGLCLRDTFTARPATLRVWAARALAVEQLVLLLAHLLLPDTVKIPWLGSLAAGALFGYLFATNLLLIVCGLERYPVLALTPKAST